MRAKKGYREQKGKYLTGKWLKWYFYKKTCRRGKKNSE